MSTAVREQIRQLTAAFDEVVDAISVEDLRGRERSPHPLADSADPAGDVLSIGRRPAGRQLSIAAVWVLLVVGTVGALVWVQRNAAAPAATPATAPARTAASASFGQFVWPAPARHFATLDELVESFAGEVLAWDAWDIVGTASESPEPQTFTLTSSSPEASVALVAIPSADGWGFVQIGQPMTASAEQPGDLVLSMPIGAGTASASVVIRLADGTTRESTDISGRVVFPDVRLEDLVSALAVTRDTGDRALTALGGVYGIDPASPATVPSSTTGVADQGVPYGPLDYATTDEGLPMWPAANVSDPPATTTGYGLQLCDSGFGTKVMRVDPAAGPAHAYSGTLCVFVDLAEPRADAVTKCATSTEQLHYARCQRRTDQTGSAGPGTSQRAAATADDTAAMQAFPSATAWDQAEVFDATVSASAQGAPAYRDGAVAVTLSTADDGAAAETVDQPGVCFVIEIPGATADGCVGRALLATGLAYGAFQDGDGPIELVGIVPDEVVAVEIGGQVVTPVNNVWHYTATSGSPLTITVRAADGRATSTL